MFFGRKLSWQNSTAQLRCRCIRAGHKCGQPYGQVVTSNLLKDVDERWQGARRYCRRAVTSAEDGLSLGGGRPDAQRFVVNELPVTQHALGGRDVITGWVPSEQCLDHLNGFMLQTYTAYIALTMRQDPYSTVYQKPDLQNISKFVLRLL